MSSPLAPTFEGAGRVKFLNYPDCVELKNSTTRIVLGHHSGGRILSYEHGGVNVLYLSKKESDWSPGSDVRPTSAGRFDVGPEMLQTRGEVIWSGEWEAEITGERSARLISALDPDSGFQVVREFSLAAEGSELAVTQTVTNRGEKTTRACYWSRTLAAHGGTAIVPLTPETERFPVGYVMYRPEGLIDVDPVDPNVRREGDYLVITGPTKYPKLGFDTSAGWLAYQNLGQLFVKRYEVDLTKQYPEANGLTMSIWYPEADVRTACEIEPIGPLETLAPGASTSFSVRWNLIEYEDRDTIDPEEIAKIVKELP